VGFLLRLEGEIGMYESDRELVGKRVRLDYHTDQFSRLKIGTEGTVRFVDGMGTVFVKWDDGSSLGMIPGSDSFSLIEGGEKND
jgi:hypothetical protein